jgi:hypothetical protein
MTRTMPPQFVTLAGRKMVLLEEAEFRRLASPNGTWEPLCLPQTPMACIPPTKPSPSSRQGISFAADVLPA